MRGLATQMLASSARVLAERVVVRWPEDLDVLALGNESTSERGRGGSKAEAGQFPEE